MINNYRKNSIGYKVMKHNNYYDADILAIFKDQKGNLPNLSVVIPYFESWNTINRALEYLEGAIGSLNYEIVVVDDGSIKYPAEKVIKSNRRQKLTIKTLEVNRGRSFARNSGLAESHNEVVAFMDADMIMPRGLVENHLKLHKYFMDEDKGCITFSLFNNVGIDEWKSTLDKEKLFESTNDFRSDCLYRETWIGCEEDKEFIGNTYQILKDTDYLRKWPIDLSFGPWLLPNMALGGFFTVNRKRALKVGGFSEDFKKYGFTETPVSTKLIARFNDYVIPVPWPYVLHLHDGGVSLNQKERDECFKKAHQLFFEVYLKQDLNKTIQNEKL